MTENEIEDACGASHSDAELDACDRAVRNFAKGIGRDLRTSEYVIFTTAWKNSAEAAAQTLEARAAVCEKKAQGYKGLDEDEATALLSLSFQFMVVATQIRTAANVK